MADATLAPVFEPTPLPVRDIMPWAIFAAVIGVIAFYFTGLEQGATAVFDGSAIHEYVHDARHLLGFPCH
ncbi:CbtB domain-containing protein [Paracoccus marinaquae]|uniref:CbtB-domain containing protein n=1 Tax=Paracoccus marinaquae TaxID=2841926 RepID=A0ABS6ANW4_9RHOB|nr:CbtB-domain containing protein [Paracoccus marinaquae]MBU3031886.1 CbtB-domain containing protein [Paracoccus marinaquae]